MSALPLVRLRELMLDVQTWNPLRSDEDDEFDYIDLSAVSQELKAISDARKLRCAEAPSRARQLVKANDVLVSTVRPNLNGVALVTNEFDGATASTGFCVARPNPERLNANYLFHWVKSDAFIKSMVMQANGASYPAVSDKIVLESVIPLPDISEQRRIAAIFDKADALRTKRREALAQLDRLAQSIFVEMFGDPIENPKGWASDLTLGDVADIVSGVTKGRNLTGKTTREVPYLAVSNVQDMRLSLDAVKVIEATEAEIVRYSLRNGDLLLTEGGDPDKLGRGTLWRSQLPECIHQNHVFRVRLKSNRLTPHYLNWLIGSQRGKQYFLKSAKQTTGIASINMTQLRGFPLLIPPLERQQKFDALLNAIANWKKSLEKSMQALDEMFSSVQSCGFKGELE